MSLVENATGYVHSFESFGSVDGPGVRFVVFVSGCSMRCLYCHNPDTWKMVSGTKYTAKEVVKRALRYKTYWGDSGGITISGGEPLLQMDFVTEIFRLAKAEGIHTTLDTAGGPYNPDDHNFMARFSSLLEVTDLVLLDLKHIDDVGHIKLTGISNQHILQLATDLSDANQDVWIRHVLVPEKNDSDLFLNKLRSFLDTLTNVKRVEVLPYHTLGTYKWQELGLTFELEDIAEPSLERVENAKKILGAVMN